MTRVKICGLMSRTDVNMAVGAGADSLGFVTEYPVPMPWNISREQAAALVTSVPPFVTTTAVVGGSVLNMVAIAIRVKPHFLQLHGDESIEEIREVCEALAGTGVKVLKALRIDAETGQARFSIQEPMEACAVLAESGVSGLIVDSMTSEQPAGTGVILDWTVIRQISASIRLPLILGGGLRVENVRQAIRLVRPYGVNVISGVEREPGVKDGGLMKDFVMAVKGEDYGDD